MFLALDIGNTFIKYGVYDSAELIEFGRIEHENFKTKKFHQFEINSVAISSVVPEVSEVVNSKLQKEMNLTSFTITKKSKFGIELDYRSVETLGIDRICAAVGSHNLTQGFKSIVYVDLGTATTINYIISGSFKGGLILPGLKTMINSLNSKTAQLPLVDLFDYKAFVGSDTKTCIMSGVINSTISLIEKSISVLDSEPKLILTGGNARYILPHLNVKHQFEKDLVLQGVKRIYELNNC